MSKRHLRRTLFGILLPRFHLALEFESRIDGKHLHSGAELVHITHFHKVHDVLWRRRPADSFRHPCIQCAFENALQCSIAVGNRLGHSWCGRLWRERRSSSLVREMLQGQTRRRLLGFFLVGAAFAIEVHLLAKRSHVYRGSISARKDHSGRVGDIDTRLPTESRQVLLQLTFVVRSLTSQLRGLRSSAGGRRCTLGWRCFNGCCSRRRDDAAQVLQRGLRGRMLCLLSSRPRFPLELHIVKDCDSYSRHILGKPTRET
mmetsp:Transcript_40469/g.107275  ORF Transcript_40469/g.107275 Transcript_40469/m.107275 type:complete len:259 (+) Transcript_40469:1045-1821(+)